MARQARGKSMDPAKVQVFHTVQRCVRRAFLCGEDAVSGKSYDHRKQWVRERLEFLASIFGIDLLTYTVMSKLTNLAIPIQVLQVLTLPVTAQCVSGLLPRSVARQLIKTP